MDDQREDDIDTSEGRDARFQGRFDHEFRPDFAYLHISNLSDGVRTVNEVAGNPTSIPPGGSKVVKIPVAELRSLEMLQGEKLIHVTSATAADYEADPTRKVRTGALSPEAGQWISQPAQTQELPPVDHRSRHMGGNGAPDPLAFASIPKPAGEVDETPAPLNRVAFEDMQPDQLRAFIKDRTGKAPVGNVGPAKLIEMAKAAEAGPIEEKPPAEGGGGDGGLDEAGLAAQQEAYGKAIEAGFQGDLAAWVEAGSPKPAGEVV